MYREKTQKRGRRREASRFLNAACVHGTDGKVAQCSSSTKRRLSEDDQPSKSKKPHPAPYKVPLCPTFPQCRDGAESYAKQPLHQQSRFNIMRFHLFTQILPKAGRPYRVSVHPANSPKTAWVRRSARSTGTSAAYPRVARYSSPKSDLQTI